MYAGFVNIVAISYWRRGAFDLLKLHHPFRWRSNVSKNAVVEISRYSAALAIIVSIEFGELFNANYSLNQGSANFLSRWLKNEMTSLIGGPQRDGKHNARVNIVTIIK